MADRNRSSTIFMGVLVLALLAGAVWFVWAFGLLGGDDAKSLAGDGDGSALLPLPGNDTPVLNASGQPSDGTDPAENAEDASGDGPRETPSGTGPQSLPNGTSLPAPMQGTGSISGEVLMRDDASPVPDVPVVLTREIGEWAWTPETVEAFERVLPTWMETRTAELSAREETLRQRVAQLAEQLASARASGMDASVTAIEEEIGAIEAEREAIAADRQLWGLVQEALGSDGVMHYPLGMAAAVLQRLREGTPFGEETATAPDDAEATPDASATHTTRTDADGRFAFTDIEAGLWAVVPTAAGLTAVGTAVVFVTPGAEEVVTLRVAGTCRVTGSVQFADGTPVPGAHVRVQPTEAIAGTTFQLVVDGSPGDRGSQPRDPADMNAENMPAWARRGMQQWRNPMQGIDAVEPPGWSTTADESGHFALPLPMSAIEFRVSAWGDDTEPAISEPHRAEAGATIAVPPLIVGSLTGLRVQVVDARTGEPVEGALVRVEDGSQIEMRHSMEQFMGEGYDGNWDPASWDGSNDTIRETDAAGEVAFIPLQARTFLMRVRARHYRTTATQEVVIEAGAMQVLTVELDPGATVAGIVVDPSGNPVAGADVRATLTRAGIGDASGFGPWDAQQLDEGLQVELIPAQDGGEPERVAALWYDRGVRTDEEGRFSLGGLGDYPVDVLVSHPDFEASWTRQLDAASSAARQLRITLSPAACVEGTVRFVNGGIPADVRVFLRSMEVSDQAMGMWGGDANGRYLEITPDAHFSFRRVTPGEYVVEALVPDHALATTEAFTVAAGQRVAGIRVVCVPGGSIAGRVLTADGEPVADALVAIDDPATRTLLAVRDVRRGMGRDQETRARMRMTRTNDEGEFLLPNVAPGSYTLRAWEGDRQAESPAPVRVTEGQQVTGVEIRLEGLGRLIVTVLDENNRPIPRLRVMVTSGNMDFRSERTGEDGRLIREGLQPGRYRVMIAEGGNVDDADTGTTVAMMFPARQVEVRSNETTEVTIGGQGVFTTLKGVVYRNGRPAADEQLAMLGDRIGVRELRTDYQGSFEVRGLAPGRYVVASGQAGQLDVLAEVRVWGQPIEHVRIDLVAASLRGLVTDTDGNAVVGAQVVISKVSEGDGLAGDLASLSARNAESGAGGEFLIENLTAGRYHIIARKEGFAHAEQTMDLSTTRHVVRLVLVAGGGEIHGTITGFEDPNLNPFFRGWVTIESASGQDLALGFQSHWLRSSSFRFEGLAPGLYRVTVEQTGGQPNTQQVQVRANETTEVVFDIAQGGSIEVDLLLDPASASGVSLLDLEVTVTDRATGTVLDRSNAVLDLAMMFLNPVTGTESPQEAYRVTLGGLPPGDLVLRIVLPGHGTVQRDVTVEPGGSTAVTIDLR